MRRLFPRRSSSKLRTLINCLPALAIICSLFFISRMSPSVTAQAGAGATPAITEFTLPGSSFENADHITQGPDGNLWFTERNGVGVTGGNPANGGAIGRITPAGVITEFPITFGSSSGGPGTNPFPIGIAVGPDPDGAGAQLADLWFTQSGTNEIGRITTSGTITEYSTGLTSGGAPIGITLGPDNNLWFTVQPDSFTGVGPADVDQIGRITAAGTITIFNVTVGSRPREIVAGPDGKIWFTQSGNNKIGRINTDGTGYIEFDIATLSPTSAGGRPFGITSGSDGAVWFTLQDANGSAPFVSQIGRIDTGGSAITVYNTPTANSAPALISAGPNNSLWFTELLANKIGRITTGGVFVGEYGVPTSGASPLGITAGPDNAIWFTENAGSPGKIGRLDLRDPLCSGGACTTFTVNSSLEANDGACTAVGTGNGCTLREAINAANASPDLNLIQFNIGGGGQQTINVNSALPSLTYPVIIDGSTQPGFTPASVTQVQPSIVLDGTGAPASTNGLYIQGGYSIVRGLSIRNFKLNGILVNKPVNFSTSNYNTIEACEISGNFRGITLSADPNFGAADYNVVKGCYIAGNSLIGVSIESADNNIIGGTTAGDGNVISGHTNGTGVSINGASNTIAGNKIGTNYAGTAALPNSVGVQVLASNNTIGGNDAPSRNVISGNSTYGIFLGSFNLFSNLSDITVSNNYIGVSANGSADLGNTLDGIYAYEGGISISALISNNVISGNNRNGIRIEGASDSVLLTTDKSEQFAAHGRKKAGAGAHGGTEQVSIYTDFNNSPRASAMLMAAAATGVTVQGNLIGTGSNGTSNIGNSGSGVQIIDSGDNIIGGTSAGQANTIAFNGGAGVSVVDNFSFLAVGNAIRGNSIFLNVGLGIDLNGDGLTVNDTDDPDDGANHLQNFPLITTALRQGNGNIIVSGSLDSTPSTQFIIDFYANLASDTAAGSEGRIYLGQTTVTTGAGSTDATFTNVTLTPSQNVPPGSFITATATRSSAPNNTSEFSAAATVQSANTVPTATNLTQTKSYTEDAPGVPLDDIVVTDPDAGDIITATLTLANPATGSLTTSGTAAYNSGTGVWMISGTVAQVNAALADVAFIPAANNDLDTTISTLIRDAENTGPAAGTITLDVTPVNDPPVANDDAYATFKNTQINIAAPGVLANDTDVESSLTATAISGGATTAGGSVTLNSNGSLSYTPPSGYTGADSFTYTASDGTDTDTATVNITVTDSSAIYINEILFNPDGTGNNEYIELRGPSGATIPAGTYFVVVDGDAGNAGDVKTIINLSNLQFGTNGFLVLLQQGNSYTTDAGATVVPSTATGFSGLPGGIWQSDAAATSLENDSANYMLIQTGAAPTLSDDIDADNDGSIDGTTFSGWSVRDSINVLDAGALARGYAAFGFRNVAGTGTSLGTEVSINFLAVYVGRNGDSTGSTAADWVASGPLGGTAPNWTLSATEAEPAGFTGKDLNHIGASNFANLAPVNTVPGAQNTNEDVPVVFTGATKISIADADAGSASVKVTLTAVNGTFSLSGITGLSFTTGDGTNDAEMVFTGTISAINTALDGLIFTPTQAFFSPPDASLTILTDDQGNTGAGGAKTDSDTVNITVAAINDPPSFTVAGNPPAVNEDAGAQTVSGFASNISQGPGESGQALTFNLSPTSTTGNLSFSSGPAINSTTGDLTYTAAQNTNGTATFSVTLSDNGSNTSPNSNTSGAQQFTITVNAVNDAPTFQLAGNPPAVNEDAAAQTVNNFATNFQPGPATATDETGQTLVGYTLTQTGSTGNLTFSAGPAISTAGVLTYTPTSNTSGTVTFDVVATDSGSGTAPSVNQSAALSFTITVNGENDAPVLDNTGDMSLASINEDISPAGNGGTLVSSIIASAGGDRITDVDAGALEGIAVTTVNNTNGTWQFSTDGGTNWTAFGSPDASNARLLAADANTRVRFLPALNFNTTVSNGLTFRAWDQTAGTNGSTANVSINGGTTAFSTATETASITVNAVNDAPAFTKGANQSIPVNAGPQTVTPWATGISAGPPDESGQTVGFIITDNTNSALFSSQPVVASNGTLSYTAAANTTGSAVITIVAKDNGGVANGGQDTSGAQTFTITVNAGNTTTQLTSSPNPSSFGEAVTLTATVSAVAPSSGTPQGSVTFKEGSTTLGTGTLNGSGQAALTISSLSVGSHLITAEYDGTTSFNTSISGVLTQTVNKASTTTALSSSVNPSAPGQDVTFTATVTSTAGTPTGTVQFKDGGVDLGAPVALNASGVATFTTGSLTVGTHNITAVYSGDANFQTSTGTLAGGQVVSIQTSISINDVSLTEGNTGTKSFDFRVTLSAASNLIVKVDFATANGTATAGTDYVSTSGTLIFNSGETEKTISVLVQGDAANEPNETFFVNLTNPQNASISDNQGQGSILNDDSPGVQFFANSYSFSEAAGHGDIIVTRGGDLSQPLTVDYRTSDQSGMTPCQTLNTGIASDRCDYATAVGTLRFAAGEGQKVIPLIIINDAYVEGAEQLSIKLSNPQGGALNSPDTATVTITDDDTQTATQNPIDSLDIFIRQLYIDFLGREPEAGGFQFWQNRITNCPAGEACDRADAAFRFYSSDEYRERGYFVYIFYHAGLGRRPTYSEWMTDVAKLNGFKTVAEQEAAREAFINEFMSRQEFMNLYNSAQTGQSFVDALIQKSGITPASKQALINNYDTLGRAKTLRAFMETQEVQAAFFDRAFVSMLYFGFLRRDPEAGGFSFWMQKLNETNKDYRLLIRGFLQSDEYRFRYALISANP